MQFICAQRAFVHSYIYIYREEGGKTIECRFKSGFNPDIGPILELKCDEERESRLYRRLRDLLSEDHTREL